jgi:hypothetical protein
MNTPDEDARDNWYSEIYDEISSEAITEFALERLRSYYLKHPLLAKDVIALYFEARSLSESSPTAALLLYTTVIEVGLKTTLLKPVIYGLVHNEFVAELVSELVVKNNGLDRFQKILALIMREYSDIDVENFKLQGHSKTIWEEINIIQKARNAVAHRAELATPEIAVLAKEVAGSIITDFLQGVLTDFGLQLQKGGKIAA